MNKEVVDSLFEYVKGVSNFSYAVMSEVGEVFHDSNRLMDAAQKCFTLDITEESAELTAFFEEYEDSKFIVRVKEYGNRLEKNEDLAKKGLVDATTGLKKLLKIQQNHPEIIEGLMNFSTGPDSWNPMFALKPIHEAIDDLETLSRIFCEELEKV